MFRTLLLWVCPMVEQLSGNAGILHYALSLTARKKNPLWLTLPFLKYITQWEKTITNEAFTNTSNSINIHNPGWYCRPLLWVPAAGQCSFVPHCWSINANYWTLQLTISCRSGSLQCSTGGWREAAKNLHSATPFLFKISETCFVSKDWKFIQIENNHFGPLRKKS